MVIQCRLLEMLMCPEYFSLEISRISILADAIDTLILLTAPCPFTCALNGTAGGEAGPQLAGMELRSHQQASMTRPMADIGVGNGTDSNWQPCRG